MFHRPFDVEFNALSEINISGDHGASKKIIFVKIGGFIPKNHQKPTSSQGFHKNIFALF